MITIRMVCIWACRWRHMNSIREECRLLLFLLDQIVIDRVLRVRVFISRWVMMIDYGAHSVLGFSVFFFYFFFFVRISDVH